MRVLHVHCSPATTNSSRHKSVNKSLYTPLPAPNQVHVRVGPSRIVSRAGQFNPYKSSINRLLYLPPTEKEQS